MKKIDFAGILRKGAHAAEFFAVGINPARDWLVAICGTTIIGMSVIFFSYLFYERINEGDIFVVENKEEAVPNTLTNESIKEVIGVYTVKREALENLKVNQPETIDPSI